MHRENSLLEKKLQRFLLIYHTVLLLVFSFQNLFLILYDMHFLKCEMDAVNISSTPSSLSCGVLYLAFIPALTLIFVLPACGGDFHMVEGIFNSPGYPEVYPSNVECVWNIISSPGNRLQLSFM